MIRALLLFVAALMSLSGVATSTVQAATQSMSRAEIRSMPIQARPNRPGHFYGNTVRRRSGY